MRELAFSGTLSLKNNLLIFFIGLLFGVLFCDIAESVAQDKSKTLSYTVEPGDFLVSIGINYGSPNFWRPIFEANRNKIKDPDLIYPGQSLVIPSSVTKSPRFVGNADTTSTKEQDISAAKTQKLKEFREAFEEVVKHQEALSKPEDKKPTPKPINGLEFGGLVINETRSKMGGDFFNVFYKYWEAPENSGNFILKITEQPVPSLGTVVAVKIDEQQVYKSRLQPRYVVIENMAKQAVMISYQTLQQRIQNSNEISAY